MKKLLTRSLILALVLGAGAAMAQTVRGTASHQVEVVIPEIAFIRIVNGNAPVAAPTPVQFSFTAATYQTGVALAPTNAGTFNWDDVQVLINRDLAAWEVVVSTADTSTGPFAGNFDWTSVTMTPTAANAFDLGTTSQLVSSSSKTTGWQALGIDPDSYTVTFDGTEDPDTYTSTVTFTLQNP